MVQVDPTVLQNWSESCLNPSKIASETTLGDMLSAFAPKSDPDHSFCSMFYNVGLSLDGLS